MQKAWIDLSDKYAVKVAGERIDEILGGDGIRLLIDNEDWNFIIKQRGRNGFDIAWAKMIRMHLI